MRGPGGVGSCGADSCDRDLLDGQASRIRRASLNGSGMQVIVDGVDSPFDIAVYKIPEPSPFVPLSMGNLALTTGCWKRKR